MSSLFTVLCTLAPVAAATRPKSSSVTCRQHCRSAGGAQAAFTHLGSPVRLALKMRLICRMLLFVRMVLGFEVQSVPSSYAAQVLQRHLLPALQVSWWRSSKKMNCGQSDEAHFRMLLSSEDACL